ncbi:MAG: D-alanyl-D-alanine carboxypeptidase [Firmicutes bacterium]|uniref:D-alanyl-D-alanine carboxypeptidase n=1 Tax=Candidatus Scybalomonas excrementavium TaxID=2840943 RepID=A0A9D9I1P6_9FIRM|nr:D-alanyl-D-alanine carboxypeptidase [Candidatus Scybalomonas excrementavium]
MRKRKKIITILCTLCLAASVTGCGKGLHNAYVVNDGAFYFLEDTINHSDRFAANLAIIPKLSYLDQGFEDDVTSELLINNTTNTPIVAVSAHAKIYPASLTKLMTAYLTCKYGKMDDVVTLEQDLRYESGAQLLHLKRGDKVTVSELYHGLLVYSANDCASMLATYIAGSEEKFVDLMNQEAKALGATNTHFQNSHGLHDPEHYTSAYDLYLMFKANLQYDIFKETVALDSYTMKYTNKNDQPLSVSFHSTNLYLTGTYKIPKGITMFGGKTGTTQAAGSCLIILTENKKGEEFISVVTGAMDKNILYNTMSKLLKQANK